MRTLIIIFGLFVISFMFMYSKNNKTPKELGVENGKLSELSKKPNCVSTQTDQQDKKVAVLPFKPTLVESKEAIIDIVKSYPNTEIIEMNESYIYAVFSTKLMKYKDDIEFYFDLDEKVIHFRSASRVGYSDMGLNKKRYEEISSQYSDSK